MAAALAAALAAPADDAPANLRSAGYRCSPARPTPAPVRRLGRTEPVAGSTTAAHEVGHMIAASVRGVKIGIPFLIPNGQLGTFGSITQIKSLPKTREDIFDVAIAGPIAGTVVASTLFFYGLALSAGGDPNELLPIPSELFSGSLLLGSVSEIFLGDTGAAAKGVMVHPLFIAGWYALILFPQDSYSRSVGQ